MTHFNYTCFRTLIIFQTRVVYQQTNRKYMKLTYNKGTNVLRYKKSDIQTDFFDTEQLISCLTYYIDVHILPVHLPFIQCKSNSNVKQHHKDGDWDSHSPGNGQQGSLGV